MIEINAVRRETDDILAILNAEEYPETYDFLSMISACENDDMPSIYDIATALTKCDAKLPMHKVVFDFAVELYESEINNKNANAMNDLGALYYDGHGCCQDFGKAVYYYNMAAENGCKVAQENLGYCYLYGRDVEVDYEKAFHYFALGAFEGYLVSLYKIGDMYQKGYYVKKNEAEAFRIYERCMDTMTDEAAKLVAGPVYLRLGNAFLYGTGTEPNAKTALICYQNAERFLFDMVNGGDVMYKKSLQAAIDGQAKARAKLTETLPEKQWLDGEKD